MYLLGPREVFHATTGDDKSHDLISVMKQAIVGPSNNHRWTSLFSPFSPFANG
jgi:hypothetical protein